jgi:hypothetical protein
MNWISSENALTKDHERSSLNDKNRLNGSEYFRKFRHFQIAFYLVHCLNLTSLII